MAVGVTAIVRIGTCSLKSEPQQLNLDIGVKSLLRCHPLAVGDWFVSRGSELCVCVCVCGFRMMWDGGLVWHVHNNCLCPWFIDMLYKRGSREKNELFRTKWRQFSYCFCTIFQNSFSLLSFFLKMTCMQLCNADIYPLENFNLPVSQYKSNSCFLLHFHYSVSAVVKHSMSCRWKCMWTYCDTTSFPVLLDTSLVTMTFPSCIPSF